MESWRRASMRTDFERKAMIENTWDNRTRSRLSRRRLLARGAGAALATGITSLAGCTPTAGPAVSTSSPTVGAALAASSPVATAASTPAVPPAKYGGTAVIEAHTGSAANMDIHTTSANNLHYFGAGIAM